MRFYFSDEEVLIVVVLMSLATDEPSASASAAMARVHTCIATRQAGEPTERRRARRSLAAKKARQQPSEVRGAR